MRSISSKKRLKSRNLRSPKARGDRPVLRGKIDGNITVADTPHHPVQKVKEVIKEVPKEEAAVVTMKKTV